MKLGSSLSLEMGDISILSYMWPAEQELGTTCTKVELTSETIIASFDVAIE